jgi:4-amino-4-deoxy-L-arabinose transferase-like glycosyltransferase
MIRGDRFALAGALAVPWLFIWQGIDFTDQGYLVTGYRCFFRHPEVTEDSGHMWLTNLIGATWDAVFGGLGLVSARALWALCMSLGMWLAYRLARSLTSETAAAFAALASSVFLSDRRETWFSYNTASSILFAAATTCLVFGIARQRRSFLFATGALIGIAPFARFPNVLALGLPSGLLLAAWIAAERRKSLPRDIAATLLGIGAGAALLLAAIYLRGDAALYWGGIASLFAPSMQNAGYGTQSLLGNFLHDQVSALGWGLAICAAAAGLSRALKVLPGPFGWLLLVGTAVLGVFGLTRGDEPWRFAVTGTSYFVLGGLALGVWRRRLELRVAAWLVLVVVLIAPLGSNNGIKNAHMGLWLALPLMLATLHGLGRDGLAGQGAKLALLFGVVLFGEGVHRAGTFVYRDGPRSALTASVSHPQLKAQYTSPARAKVVAEVLNELERRVAPGDYLLAYEGAPLIQYLTRTRPYLNRPWLMGWERGDVIQELAATAPKRTGCLPVVVVTTKSTSSASWPTHAKRLDQRQPQRGARRVLKAFLRGHAYERKWSNGFFEILEPPSGTRVRCR